ncbi:hypothetical protein [Agriterribacter sp.]|uniref:hypothetical protein n=1 Tax=Agriterribacter sp. TaxID=2821509 RepID=UPI002BF79B2C|nr:hypothetical protein [Agriterribacter sp.]HTN08807.1 hypothetical protein [Agriterribacter sp.]
MLVILLLSFLCSVPGAGLPARVNIHEPVPAIAYVSKSGNDQTARPGNSGKPFFTVTAALAAIPAGGGTIVIGPGEFDSPKHGSMKSHIVLMGSGKPEPDWNTEYDKETGKLRFTVPQKLIGGTVLKGTLDCSLLDHIVIKDLGVDVGALWCKERNNGDVAEGLFFAQKYNLKGGLSAPDKIHELQVLSPPRKGIVVENVSALCRDAKALVHAMLFENLYCPQISNISTYFGVHGVVLKTQGGQLNNMLAHGHFSNGLIVKSNDYAFGGATSISNVYVTSIEPGDGGGIRLVGERETLKNITITNFVVERARFGITNNGDADGAILSNGHLLDCADYSIAVNAHLTHSIFSNIIARRQGVSTIISFVEQDNKTWTIK